MVISRPACFPPFPPVSTVCVCVCVCVYIYIYLSKKNSQTHTVQTRAAIAVDLQQPLRDQGGVRHSVRQGIWWDRSLDSL